MCLYTAKTKQRFVNLIYPHTVLCSLVFLPGQEEIEDLAGLLRFSLEEEEKERTWTGDKVVAYQGRKTLGGGSLLIGNVMICLLYAALPPEAQMVAFQDKPYGCDRKIILATNIAETSVTLPDIRYVVDTGKHKCRQITATGMESLKVENISQSQAAQRAGRAGRIQEGTCFRLYPQSAFESLPVESVPEIFRVDIAQVLLQILGMGISDPSTFQFVTPPELNAVKRATRTLNELGALNEKVQLTKHGRKLAQLPLDPIYGHLLIKGSEHGCLREMLTAVSVLSAENIFYRPSGDESQKAASRHQRFSSYEGDIPTGLKVYHAWQTEAVYVPASSGGHKKQKKLLQQQQQQQNSRGPKHPVLSHGEWCQQNYVSGRAMVRAFSIRAQLESICQRDTAHNGLGMDTQSSSGDDVEQFLRAVAAGLFLQAASRDKSSTTTTSQRGQSGNLVQHQRLPYRTKVGKERVAIHPSSGKYKPRFMLVLHGIARQGTKLTCAIFVFL